MASRKWWFFVTRSAAYSRYVSTGSAKSRHLQTARTECRSALVGATIAVLAIIEQVARFAIEFAADRFERREADRAGLAGLEDRQVGERDPHPVRQPGKRQPAIVQPLVEPDDDRAKTLTTRSRRIAATCAHNPTTP